MKEIIHTKQLFLINAHTSTEATSIHTLKIFYHRSLLGTLVIQTMTQLPRMHPAGGRETE